MKDVTDHTGKYFMKRSQLELLPREPEMLIHK
jgi:hypothetical protein